MQADKQDYLRQIPAVNDLLALEKGSKLKTEYNHDLVVEGIREVTDKLREKILNTKVDKLDQLDLDLSPTAVLAQVEAYLEDKLGKQLLPAVNATGVVVHTNLGRSLLCSSAQKRLQEAASRYSTLEIDRETGERGSRYKPVEDLLTELTGAEAGLVVNNNAAAVLLALNTLAAGQEAVLARGELVEIGGSFRIPEVMKQSGVELKEIGTTNRVHLSDYEAAVNENTGLLLKVHTSNYKVMGFSKEVALDDLVELSEDHDLPVLEDLGSGILVDLSGDGLSYEPTVQDSIQAGVDVVTFSGDKLLGGPQAGIIVGKKEYIEQMKANQLTRALRVDKFTMAALEATLQEYRDLEQAKENIPTLRMIKAKPAELKAKAKQLAAQLEKTGSEKLEFNIKESTSRVGGGAFPVEELETYIVELVHAELSAEELAEKLRLAKPPIFTRISGGAVILDVRTLSKEDINYIVEAIANITL